MVARRRAVTARSRPPPPQSTVRTSLGKRRAARDATPPPSTPQSKRSRRTVSAPKSLPPAPKTIAKKTKRNTTGKKPRGKQQVSPTPASKSKTKKKTLLSSSPKKPVKEPEPSQPKGRKKASKQAPIVTPPLEDFGRKKARKGKSALVPRPQVPLYHQDPLYFSQQEVPFLSSLAHSQLLFRAVFLKDWKLLKKLLSPSDISTICTLQPQNNLTEQLTPLDLAIREGSWEAVKLLLQDEKDATALEKKLGPFPDLLMEQESTGRGSYHMFGHGLRQVALARGGKEGPAAFLKDAAAYNSSFRVPSKGNLVSYILNAIRRAEHHLSLRQLDELVGLVKDENSVWVSLLSNVDEVVRGGHWELAGRLISLANKRGGYGFNFLHEEVLTKVAVSDFKAVSATKKCLIGSRFTPIHIAAINPNPANLEALLAAVPEYSIVDRQSWTPIHYAACCERTGPLEFLLRKGVSSQVVEKDGNSPLLLAIRAGRVENVKLLLEKEGEGEDVGPQSSLEKPNKKGLRAVHFAARIGSLPIMKLLLDRGADPEKFTPAHSPEYEKMNALMIACAHGHLELVRFLVEERGVKLVPKDRRGRTAIFHAVMNGHSHVLSYLLRLGVKADVKDSSGNGLAHYAAAYGWYFPLKLLMEAGCDVTSGNDWKTTPLAAAFMKGHMGLVEMLVKMDGVDINTVIDVDFGFNLLLTACAKASFKSSLVPRLSFLIEQLGADCGAVDFKGNSALHLLNLSPSRDLDSEEWKNQLKNQCEAAKYLVSRGCRVNALNHSGQCPLTVACAIRNYWFAEHLLELGTKLTVPSQGQDSGVDEGGEIENNLLVILGTGPHLHLNLVNLLLEKLSKSPQNLNVLKELVGRRKEDGVTPLFHLLIQLTKHSKRASEEEIKEILQLISFLVRKLGADVNAQREKEGEKEARLSVLHSILHLPYAIQILPILLESRNLVLDPVDQQGRTPLASLLLLNTEERVAMELARALIKAGANVNVKVIEEGKERGLVILLAQKRPSMFPLIPDILKRGANCEEVCQETGNGLLNFIAQNPTQSASLATAEELIRRSPRSLSMGNLMGRTPLHLLLNSRGKQTDVFYDLESLFLDKGASLEAKDVRGRTALHYVFVKIGRPFDQSELDPVELLMLLLTPMEPSKRRELILTADLFGMTPIHYAALRGATISLSYFTGELLPHGHPIDIPDKKGNSPFAYAVWAGHQSVALHLLERGANFLSNLDSNIVASVPQPTAQKEEDEEDEDDSDGDDDGSSSQESGAEVNNYESKPNKKSWRIDWKEEEDEGKGFEWEHVRKTREEKEKEERLAKNYPIFQEVVQKEWQGILHIMIAKLLEEGRNLSVPLAAAIKTNKFRLALKLLRRVRRPDELIYLAGQDSLLHLLCKQGKKQGDEGTLQLELLSALVDKGLSPTALDRKGTNALLYAASNHNFPLITELERLPGFRSSGLKEDVLGRTPFTTLFWKLNELGSLSPELMSWASSLLKMGCNGDQLTRFPILLSRFPVVRCRTLSIESDYRSFPKFSPLIVCVILGKYDLVGWLLKQKIDVNFGDKRGLTALMHACRLNDLRMIKLLLNPASYKPSQDNDPYGLNYEKSWNWKEKSRNPINLLGEDQRGWTALDHFVSPAVESNNSNLYSYANVEPILTIFHKCGVSFTRKSGDGISPLERALGLRATPILTAMYRLMKTPPKEQQKPVDEVSRSELPPLPLLPTIANSDFRELSRRGLERKRLEMEAERERKGTGLKPDPLFQMKEGAGEVVEEDGQPLDCILSQVDLSYGLYGMYNFYKMQLVKERKGKELILLLTQWGRVGDQGQHQKTPFPSLPEGVREFKKIFKAKTGVEWEARDPASQALPKKYKVLKKDLQAVRASEVPVDFKAIQLREEKCPSQLPRPVKGLLQSLISIHKARVGREGIGYCYGLRANEAVLVAQESLQKGSEILEKIKALLIKQSLMQSSENEGKYKEEDKLKVLQELVSLSEEFYSLVPSYGFAKEALTPIFDFSTLRQREEEIHRLVHLGFAKELLLATELSGTGSPLDYLAANLGVRLSPVAEESYETQLILQYIHNSSAGSTKVTGIHKILEEKWNETAANGIGNKWLLWHGTKADNVLSILHHGLQIAPLGVDRMGELFGKGIYFADTFGKSESYCEVGGNRGEEKFIFLCEVSLGKVEEVRLDQELQRHVEGMEKELPKGFHSSKTADSKFIPDPAGTIFWEGKHMPLGKPIERVMKKGEEEDYYGLHYNEYIVFKAEQVRLSHLVTFK